MFTDHCILKVLFQFLKNNLFPWCHVQKKHGNTMKIFGELLTLNIKTHPF